MRNYQHKFDAARQLVAVQVTPNNASEIAEWCGGRELEGGVTAIEVPVQGGASSVIASEDDYVVLDTTHEFHVRSPQIFEAKYRQSENQDSAFDFTDDRQEMKTWPDDHLNNEGYIESDEKGFISPSEDDVSGETDGDADRLQ